MFVPLRQVIADYRQQHGTDPTLVRVGARIFAVFLDRAGVTIHPSKDWTLSLSWPWTVDLRLDPFLSGEEAIAG